MDDRKRFTLWGGLIIYASMTSNPKDEAMAIWKAGQLEQKLRENKTIDKAVKILNDNYSSGNMPRFKTNFYDFYGLYFGRNKNYLKAYVESEKFRIEYKYILEESKKE